MPTFLAAYPGSADSRSASGWDAVTDAERSAREDARSMKSCGTRLVGHNVQTMVDADHHLIVTHTVTNVGADRRQLGPMAIKAKSVLGVAPEERIIIIADNGYYRGEDLMARKVAT